MLSWSALTPAAVLALPVALFGRALVPTAVLLFPVLWLSAKAPHAVLLLPATLFSSARDPTAVLLLPVLVKSSAASPNPVLLLPLPEVFKAFTSLPEPPAVFALVVADGRVHPLCPARRESHEEQACNGHRETDDWLHWFLQPATRHNAERMVRMALAVVGESDPIVMTVYRLHVKRILGEPFAPGQARRRGRR